MMAQTSGTYRNSQVFNSSQDPECSRGNGKGKDRNQSLVVLTLGAVALFVVTWLVAVVIYMVIQGTLAPRPQSSAFACVPCEKLLPEPTTRQEMTIEVRDGREFCCAYGTEQISALFVWVDKSRNNIMLPDGRAVVWNSNSISAHKRVYPENISSNRGLPNFPSKSVICELKPDDPRWGEHHKGVDILEHGLRIKMEGVYYVYASLQFRPQSEHPCKEFKFQTFTASVEKKSPNLNHQQLLLEVVHTCCDDCRNSQNTRFTGGAFILQHDDEIRVKVIGIELILFNPYTSFIGLVML